MNFFVDFQQDWTQLVNRCNWYTFRFCLIEFEWDKILGGAEVTFVILGLGIRLRLNYTETEEMVEMNKAMQDIAERLSLDDE